MSKSAVVYARIDEELKLDAENIMNQLGISPSSMIQMLYKQVILRRQIPFEVSLPEKSNANFDRVNILKKDDLSRILRVIPESVDELWIFGSAVTPYCRPDSDIDICLIGDNITFEDEKLISKAPKGAKDIISVTHEEFNRLKNEIGSIYKNVYEKGLLIYKKGEGLVNEFPR